jgi:uncharacterized protein (DUF488 family)
MTIDGKTLYTFGYRGESIGNLKAHVERLNGMVVDVRYNPYSPNPTWSKLGLMKVFGERYIWLKDLGNRNYKGGPIEIVDMEAGLARIEGMTAPILLCACSDVTTCHRQRVAVGAMIEGWRIEHIAPTASPALMSLLF